MATNHFTQKTLLFSEFRKFVATVPCRINGSLTIIGKNVEVNHCGLVFKCSFRIIVRVQRSTKKNIRYDISYRDLKAQPPEYEVRDTLTHR
jgi:hypothetical protein